MNSAKVTHIVVNNLGGITSLIKNLILFKDSESLDQEMIVLNIKGNKNTPADFSDIRNCPVRYFHIDPKENWHYTYKKLSKFIGEELGVIVSNDVFDLIAIRRFNLGKKVVQIVHDAYNLRLSLQYEKYIDAFICHSEFIYDLLYQFFPNRKKDIHLLYYGIPLQQKNRQNRLHNEPLKLVFLGRHDKAKGVYDLYEINAILKANTVPVQWTILGKGPETEALKQQWSRETNVIFDTPANDQLYQVLTHQDILVFPTKFEGFPVALVEAMSLGCIPVVSNLPGGIRELVNEQTGYKCELDNNAAFADAILKLHNNRRELEEKSRTAFAIARSRHDAIVQTKAYQQLFRGIALESSTPNHHNETGSIGSRLDRRWIPNFVTKTIRRAVNG